MFNQSNFLEDIISTLADPNIWIRLAIASILIVILVGLAY